MKHIATIFSFVLLFLCGCREMPRHKDIDILGLTGDIRNITIIRTTDKPCNMVGINEQTNLFSFKDGDFTDINGCVIFDRNDTTYMYGRESKTGNPPADAYFFKTETKDEGYIFEGEYYSTEDPDLDFTVPFKTQMTFDAANRISTISDDGFMTQILGLEPDAEASTIHYEYENESSFPSAMTYIIYIGGDSIVHKIKYSYSKTDNRGNWTERKAQFCENGETAYTEVRKIDYWK